MHDTDPVIADQKQALRAQAHTRRGKVAQADRADLAKFVAAHFFNTVTLEPSAIVACYWPIRDEIDCKPIMTELMEIGQPVCLPVVVDENLPLQMRLWEPDTPLYESGFGTLAPVDNAPVVEPDIVLIPLLAFDKTGTRLGYGRGYYDRTIADFDKTPKVVGIGFAAQELEHIPRGAHDVPLDIVITEDGPINFGAS